MLSQISWAEYLKMITCALTVYYAFIVMMYYKHDLVHLMKRKQKTSTRPISSAEKATDARAQLSINPEGENQNSKLLQALTDEIRALASAMGSGTPAKSDLLLSLHQVLSKYPTVKLSSHKAFIENFIIAEYATNCSVHLSEAELKGVWI